MNPDIFPLETPRDFTKAVELAVETALSDRGLLRLRKWCFVSPINDEFDVFIGLNRGFNYSRFGHVSINPDWGIHSRTIGRLCAEWRGERYRRGAICTAPISLDGVVKQEIFRFRAGSDLAVTAQHLADNYADQVVPALQPYGSYKAIVPCLESFADAWGGWDQSLLLSYKLAGWHEKAVAYAEERAKECEANQSYSEYFLAFLEKYRAHFV